MALLDLEPLLKRSTAKLSGGERQRVAIGRALLAQPDLLLMDEPVSSLDVESKDEIIPRLERLRQALSIPVIYVSHDPAEVARVADRVLVIDRGRLAAPATEPGLVPAGQMSESAARDALASLGQARVTELAIAALMAGLAGDGSGGPAS